MQIDVADRRTPEAIRRELGRFGGLNPYGRANWRVIVAEDHLVLRGGVHTTMPNGNVSVFEVDPHTFEVHRREVKPDKVETGWKMVPRWPVKGWIIERWFPAHTRNRTEWEEAKSTDGSPMMGPFPEQGYYFMLGGPWEQLPEMHDLKTAISMHIREEEANPVSYKQMLLNEINEEQAQQEKAYQRAFSALQHFYESEVEPILRGTSLGAQRIRNEMQEAIGDRSHMGVA